MTIRIDTKRGRDSLPARREPWWRKLSEGQYLGLRKLDDGSCTWIARYTENRKHEYRALGDMTEAFGFEAAKAVAESWFNDRARGVTGRTLSGDEATVAAACRAYVEDRRKQKGEACAHDAHRRFERTVYGSTKHAAHPIAPLRLDKLRSRMLANWRDQLVTAGLSKASANRTLIALKAALNQAVRDRLVTADRAQEWHDVAPFKGAGKRRDLYLDLAQRRALLAACEGALADLVRAVTLTGCRAGELTNALRSQFDARTQTLTVTGKTGTRAIPLAPAALAFFTRLAKAKLPNARLITRDDGKPWQHSDWDQLVREAAKAAGLPEGVCLYTLRHSFITQTLLDGLASLEVARMVGTSLQMLERHYGHLCASTAREKLAKVALL